MPAGGDRPGGLAAKQTVVVDAQREVAVKSLAGGLPAGVDAGVVATLAVGGRVAESVAVLALFAQVVDAEDQAL